MFQVQCVQSVVFQCDPSLDPRPLNLKHGGISSGAVGMTMAYMIIPVDPIITHDMI